MPDNQATTCFIDTNIWLYAFIETDDTTKSATARTLIQESEPIVSTQVINEVCVNLIKKAVFAEEQVRQLIDAFYEKYPVVELEQETLNTDSDLRQRYAFSYWDSLVIASALVQAIQGIQQGIVGLQTNRLVRDGLAFEEGD